MDGSKAYLFSIILLLLLSLRCCTGLVNGLLIVYLFLGEEDPTGMDLSKWTGSSLIKSNYLRRSWNKKFERKKITVFCRFQFCFSHDLIMRLILIRLIISTSALSISLYTV